MKKLSIIFICLILSIFSFAQTSVQLSPEVISSAGGYYEGNNISISWTLGEPVIETVSGGGITLTQGFQQPTENAQPNLFSLDGTITYDNAANSPVHSIKVELIKEAATISSDTTDINGYFKFNNLANGVYSLKLTSLHVWIESDPGDALNVNRYYIGAVNIIDSLRLKAGNVTNDPAVDPGDALMINRRYIGALTQFKISDWIFDVENPSLTINGANITQNFKAICAGDINASGDPTTTRKTSQDVLLSNNDVILINSVKDFEIPVKVSKDLILGAFGLVIKYPSSLLNIKEVTSEVNGLVYNIKNDEVRIAWSSNNNAMQFNNNDALIKLKASSKKSIGKGDIQLKLDVQSVLVDNNIKSIKGETLNIPRISFENSIQGDFFLSHNIPNPFNNVTKVEYKLPEAGQISLTVYNLLGEKIKDIVNMYQNSGYYQVNIDRNDLAEGAYMYKLSVKGVNSEYTKTRMMIVSQ